MSVVSRMEANPSRVRILLSILAERGGESEARLRAFCSPETITNTSARQPTAIFDATLAAAKDLGLIEEAEQKLRVAPGVLTKRGRLGEDAYRAIERALLPTEDDEPVSQIDFAKAVSWVLLQSPKRPLPLDRNYNPLIQEQLNVAPGEVFDLTSSDRWNSFVSWCRYLGYGEVIAGRALVADPSAALRRLLPTVFGGEREAPFQRVLTSLARLTPVFETGRVRRRIEEDCKPNFQREPQRLSQSTSFALTRLEHDGLVRLDARPDAPAMILDLGADAARRLSHVVLWGGRA